VVAVYEPIDVSLVPDAVRDGIWDTTVLTRGWIVKVAYYRQPFTRCEAGPGAAFRRTTDTSDGSVVYARRVDPS
jgi:hypothetical protein